MTNQIEKLRRIQNLHHGTPRVIQCDREYNNHQFKKFCEEEEIELVLVAANDHEAN